MTNDKEITLLLTKWDAELVDIDQTVHEAVEKSRKRIYELKLKFAKIEKAEPIQVDFDEQSYKGETDF